MMKRVWSSTGYLQHGMPSHGGLGNLGLETSFTMQIPGEENVFCETCLVPYVDMNRLLSRNKEKKMER